MGILSLPGRFAVLVGGLLLFFGTGVEPADSAARDRPDRGAARPPIRRTTAGSAGSFAGFLGGREGDHAFDIAVDAQGCAYVVGYTWNPPGRETDFPLTPGAWDRSYNGDHDAFVTKFSADGDRIIYSTLLGGTGNDYGYGIVVDTAGRAYVTGSTASRDFPVTPDTFSTEHSGESDIFVTVLDPSGSGLVFSTLVGGSREEKGADIALGPNGCVFTVGTTWSDDFPVTPGAFDSGFNGIGYTCDGVVFRLDAAGGDLLYSTYLGGSGEDYGNGVAVDTAGRAHVTGQTYRSDFPTTPGSFSPEFNGGYDAFLTKLEPDGSGLVYSTFLGGSSFDGGHAVALDDQGQAVVAGETLSGDFPRGAWSQRMGPGGYMDAFAVKLDSTGSAVLYAGVLGGSGYDWATGIAEGPGGHILIAGSSDSVNFPIRAGDPGRPSAWISDIFAARIDPAAGSLRFSTRLGGSENEWGYGLAVNADGDAFLTGETWSADFPATPGAYDEVFDNRVCDAVAARLVTLVPKKSPVRR